MKEKYISFSEAKMWNECPYRHKLVYIDKIPYFNDTLFTAFGSACHETLEQLLLLKKNNDNTEFDSVLHFKKCFYNEMIKLKVQTNDPKILDRELAKSMIDAGTRIVALVLPELIKEFKDFEVVACEYRIYSKIEDFIIPNGDNFYFKGYVDLIIKSNNIYYVIDYKTCSWGWDQKKKSDKLMGYQLALYKHFISKELDVPVEQIETYFVLLKRTAKNNLIEPLRITSGKKKIENSLNMIKVAIYNIIKNDSLVFKNRQSCGTCIFKNTMHCK